MGVVSDKEVENVTPANEVSTAGTWPLLLVAVVGDFSVESVPVALTEHNKCN